MELLYIYIEDDGRNIKNCEFNFSPKHRFHYDKTTNTLSKEDICDYIPNFWGSNIKNITAVIGKNGAGKSNLIEFVIKAIAGKLENTKRILAWTHKHQFFINYQVENNFNALTCRGLYTPFKSNDIYQIQDTLILYYSPNIDRKIITDRHNTNNFKDISTANLIRFRDVADNRDYHFPEVDYAQIIDTFRQLLFLDRYEKSFLPSDITIPKFLDIELYCRETNANHPTYQKHSINTEKNTFEKKLKNIILGQVFAQTISSTWDESTPFNDVIGVNKRDADNLSFYDEMIKLYNQGDIECKIQQREGLRKWSDFKFSIKRTAIDGKIFTSIMDYYHKIGGFNNPSFTSVEHDSGYLNNSCIIKWKGLSSGELALLNLFSRIFSKLSASKGEIFNRGNFEVIDKDESKYKHVILFLDEPELSFHPEWQRRFIYLLTTALSSVFKTFNFQIIVASHSPILVSDFPKNNIIFLNKNDDGACMVEESIGQENTFGANIHTLYRNSFFIEGMPIGDFAKTKIEAVFNILRNNEVVIDKETENYCRKIIELIGEPILKKQLMKLLYERQSIADKIAYHEQEAIKLKAKLNKN
ncbi:MAG: AAA family ATPase [Anaerovoracaceae bacterium]